MATVASKVYTMKETVLVIFFLSLQFSPSTSASGKEILQKVTDTFAKITNVGLGTYSRSATVAALSRLQRRENSAKVKESLNQVISTLALLDIGGGILVPGVQHVVNTVAKDSAFRATRRAFEVYNGKMVGQLNRKSWSSLKSADMKKILKVQKQKILSTFSDDVAKLSRHSKTLKYIKRAKNLFRVNSVAKVLGPLFDTISVGINTWALSTTIRDCNNDPRNCNRGAIASASLGIASGIIGVGTFVAALVTTGTVSAVLGPVGALVSVTLAICATLIELYYPDPARLNALRREQRLSFMRQLDQYSRKQLYAVHRFMAEKKVERSDVYVVNQALLPRYFKPENELIFGEDASKNPRRSVFIKGECKNPWKGIERFEAGNPMTSSAKHRYCPTLVDGMKMWLESKNDETGYGFFGFVKNARVVKGDYGKDNFKPSKPYKGSIVLINTDQVQRSELKKQRETHLNQDLRSIRINTKEKGRGGAYDDLVSVGNMENLHQNGWVRIRTGDGNDALNIDGFPSRQQGRLEAILGSGHNTLSFLGMPEDKNLEIEGIEYEPQSQMLHYFLGSNRNKHYVGTVRGIKILSASPFQDIIHLFASTKSQKGDDFTVFKFKGKADYIFDIKKVAGSPGDVPFKFKIIDNTDNGQSEETLKCHNHNPLLKIINTGTSGVANDILYRADRRQILIYGKNSSQQDHSDIVSSTDDTSTAAASPVSRCSGEPSDGNHPKGGIGKRLLAIVSFQTKCPGVIKADTDESGNCMMATRKVSKLDTIFYDGNHYSTDFTRDIKAMEGMEPTSSKTSVCTLKCPQTQVTRSTKIEIGLRPNGVLIIGSELFLDPCDMGKEGVLLLKKKSCLLWELLLEGTPTKFTGSGKRHQLYGFKKIVNENGDTIVDLSEERRIEIDLYKMYAKKTVKSLAETARHDRSSEVAESLEECYSSSMSLGSASICRP
ncbi:hypothetical protein ACROYT_G003341 [Oculina patagonica]